RRVAGQGRWLRHPGPCRGVHPLPVRQPFQRRRPAAVRDRAIAAGRRMAAAITILVSASPGEWRTALLEGDVLTEAWVERPGRPDGVGDLQRGRVTAVAPAMAGAFVLLAGGETGFLPESEASRERRPIGAAVQEGLI